MPAHSQPGLYLKAKKSELFPAYIAQTLRYQKAGRMHKATCNEPERPGWHNSIKIKAIAGKGVVLVGALVVEAVARREGYRVVARKRNFDDDDDADAGAESSEGFQV